MQRKYCARSVVLFAIVAFTNAPALSQSSVVPSRTAPTASSNRIIVKLRPALAAEVAALLPLHEMVIASGKVPGSRAQSFMSHYAVRRMRPLYPEMVRKMQQQHTTDKEIASEVRQQFGARAKRFTGTLQPPELSRTYVLEVDGTIAAECLQTLTLLKLDPNVEYAEPDRQVSVDLTPNDPFLSTAGSWGQSYDDLWGMKTIGSPAAWDTTAGAGIVVAVVDTGIDFTHPDIAANIYTNPHEIAGNGLDDDANGYVDDVHGWNFVASNNDPTDDFGHGTHVAGTIAALGNNGIGVIGVAWRSKIMPLKGLDSSGYGWDSVLATAIIYATNNGADVISNSWGGPGSSQTLTDAVSYAHSLGAVIVAAAGNSHDDASKFSPAGLPDVITVSASTPDDQLAFFSNYGDKIDVAAPGVDILSLQAGGTMMGIPVSPGYTRADGTSMATPHVSGTAALILSQHPEYSNEEVRQVLRSSATDVSHAGFNTSFGYGRLNATGAMAVTGPLEAKIWTPVDGTVVEQGTVTVTGVAAGPTFVSYTLEYGRGTQPSAWTTLTTSATAVSGTLGTLKASAISNGTYTIRLTAMNSAGQGFTDRVLLSVPKVEITDPVPTRIAGANSYKPGAIITITGSADDPAFQNFRVEWARGLDPSSGWQSTGITLSGNGVTPVVSSSLAMWDTTAITSADYYSIRLVVTGTVTTEARTMVYLEPDLTSVDWPRYLDIPLWWPNGVVPARNRGGDSRLLVSGLSPDTVTGGHPGAGAFFTMSPDGSSLQKTELPPPAFGSLHQSAAGDLDRDGSDEGVVADPFVLRIYRQDLSSYAFSPSQSVAFWNAPPVIEDLDGDSQLETLAFASDAINTGYLFAWRPDGRLLNSNFPIIVSDTLSTLEWPGTIPFVVGDIDGDGRNEIVVKESISTSAFTLRIFDNSGLRKTWNVPVVAGVPMAMVAADLDHGGKLQTIVVTNADSAAIVHVFQPDGSERRGWPVVLANGRSTPTFLAIGDLDHDGVDEIVVSHGALDVLRADGTVFPGLWPIQPINGAYGPVIIGDVTGDGLPDLITALSTYTFPQNTLGSFYAQQLLALSVDGTIQRSWQITGMNGSYAQVSGVPTLGDFDHDGNAEIALALNLDAQQTPTSDDPVQSLAGKVLVLSTGTSFHAAANAWPMMYLNARNSAVLRHDFAVASTSSAQTIEAGQSGNYTITASAPTYYGHAITFACTGLPAGAACVFAPASLTLRSDPASVALTVQTTARTLARLGNTPHSVTVVASLAFCVLGFVMLPSKRLARTRRRLTLSLAIIAICGSWAACGGGGGQQDTPPAPSGTPAGTYTIVVAATGNGGTKCTTNLTLTVR